jgi:hypothetical protein
LAGLCRLGSATVDFSGRQWGGCLALTDSDVISVAAWIPGSRSASRRLPEDDEGKGVYANLQRLRFAGSIHAFVILGWSTSEAKGGNPGIHAATEMTSESVKAR